MKKPLVYFEETKDYFRPKGVDVWKIDKIINKMRRMDSPSDPKEIVFRCTRIAVPQKPSEYNFEKYFSVAIVPQRKLQKDEIELCKFIQELINLCSDSDEFIKLFSTMFERFIYSEESDKHPKCTYHNAKIFVNGYSVELLNHQSIDIGIDEISKKNNFEVMECCLSSWGFLRGKKIDQLRFYAEALQRVRQTLGRDLIISMKMVAGYSDERSIKRVFLPDKEKFNSNGIKPVFITQLNPAIELTL